MSAKYPWTFGQVKDVCVSSWSLQPSLVVAITKGQCKIILNIVNIILWSEY